MAPRTPRTWSIAPSSRDRRSWFARGDYEQAIAAQIGRGLSEPGLQKMAEGVIRRWRQLAPDVLRNFFGEDDPSRELRHVLPRIGMPTLVLHGEDDRLVPVEAGRYLAEHIPGALLHVFKGRGHVPFVTAPTEFTHVLRSFIFAGRLP
jgi:pimeloyl-ACP methyl ester carboxylesterase